MHRLCYVDIGRTAILLQRGENGEIEYIEFWHYSISVSAVPRQHDIAEITDFQGRIRKDTQLTRCDYGHASG